jgi:hypothetical protein
MTKQDFIEKWIGWVSYTDREKLENEMESDLEAVSQALRIHDVVGRSEQLPCRKCGDYGTIDNQDGTVSTCPCHY